MKKKTSVSLSDEVLAIADSIAATSERSRSWVIEKAITLGLPALDTAAARELRKQNDSKKK